MCSRSADEDDAVIVGNFDVAQSESRLLRRSILAGAGSGFGAGKHDLKLLRQKSIAHAGEFFVLEALLGDDDEGLHTKHHTLAHSTSLKSLSISMSLRDFLIASHELSE